MMVFVNEYSRQVDSVEADEGFLPYREEMRKAVIPMMITKMMSLFPISISKLAFKQKPKIYFNCRQYLLEKRF